MDLTMLAFGHGGNIMKNIKVAKMIQVSFIALVLGTLSLVSAHAEMLDPERLRFIFGPRVGISYLTISPQEFSAQVSGTAVALDKKATNYFPMLTQFGISLEQRILLGTTKSHFAFQEVISLSGIDQSLAIPNVAFLLGYRSEIGLEFGLGPKWSIDGLSVLYALGWTFTFSDVYVPVDIAIVPDFRNGHHSFSFYTGFNF